MPKPFVLINKMFELTGATVVSYSSQNPSETVYLCGDSLIKKENAEPNLPDSEVYDQ